jgi:hypothetical protein
MKEQKASTQTAAHGPYYRCQPILQERIEAQKAFGGTAEEQAAKKEAAKTFVPGEGIEAEGAEKKEEPKKVGPTPEQITAIKVGQPGFAVLVCRLWNACAEIRTWGL